MTNEPVAMASQPPLRWYHHLLLLVGLALAVLGGAILGGAGEARSACPPEQGPSPAVAPAPAATPAAPSVETPHHLEDKPGVPLAAMASVDGVVTSTAPHPVVVQLRPKRTLHQLTLALRGIDGVFVVAAPRVVEDAAAGTTVAIDGLLTVQAGVAGYVVVDASWQEPGRVQRATWRFKAFAPGAVYAAEPEGTVVREAGGAAVELLPAGR
ncbi:MAG: hypothetical protein H6747_10765 [Deltaproteobacteria bacterium]|nr:hypothetical protein [Deltaproteobacteria bacterium]